MGCTGRPGEPPWHHCRTQFVIDGTKETLHHTQFNTLFPAHSASCLQGCRLRSSESSSVIVRLSSVMVEISSVIVASSERLMLSGRNLVLQDLPDVSAVFVDRLLSVGVFSDEALTRLLTARGIPPARGRDVAEMAQRLRQAAKVRPDAMAEHLSICFWCCILARGIEEAGRLTRGTRNKQAWRCKLGRALHPTLAFSEPLCHKAPGSVHKPLTTCDLCIAQARALLLRTTGIPMKVPVALSSRRLDRTYTPFCRYPQPQIRQSLSTAGVPSPNRTLPCGLTFISPLGSPPTQTESLLRPSTLTRSQFLGNSIRRKWNKEALQRK